MHDGALVQKWKTSRTAEKNNKKSERKISFGNKKDIEDFSFTDQHETETMLKEKKQVYINELTTLCVNLIMTMGLSL
jgi:hypothetical protein